MLRNARLRSRSFIGHRHKNTLLNPDSEVDNVHGKTRSLCYLSVQSLMKRSILGRKKMSQEEGFFEYWRTIFQARVQSPRHHQHEDGLRFVQIALDNIHWTIDKTEFDELIAKKTLHLLDIHTFSPAPKCRVSKQAQPKP